MGLAHEPHDSEPIRLEWEFTRRRATPATGRCTVAAVRSLSWRKHAMKARLTLLALCLTLALASPFVAAQTAQPSPAAQLPRNAGAFYQQHNLVSDGSV